MYTPKTLVPYGLNFEDGIKSCAAMSGGKSFLLSWALSGYWTIWIV